MEHELLWCHSADSWKNAQQPNPCTPAVIQGLAGHVCLPSDDPIDDFSEEDMATGSMVAAVRSPNKHPRSGSGGQCGYCCPFGSACMGTKVDSMMDHLEKRIDEKIVLQLGLVMDRLSGSTRSRPSSLSDNGVFFWSEEYYWCCTYSICSFVPGNQGVVWMSRQKHTWLDGGTGQRNHR